MRTLLLCALALSFPGCTAGRTSTRCTSELNHCLGYCPQEPRTSERERSAFASALQANDCEQRCYHMGRACDDAEEKREKESREKQQGAVPGR
jgi:hypothetical protein